MVADNGEAPPVVVPVVATMSVVLYADGSFGMEMPLNNLPVCHSMVGLAAAHLAFEQARRTRADLAAILRPGDAGMKIVGGG